MRPRYLELEGLQSFKEAQRIDFDRLGETGLFGIFGPTGSGKSTILDALTLALYGNVQRANRGTQGIINTASDSVRVSFTFELTRGKERKTYRVERVYRRKKDSENSIESRVARLIELSTAGEAVIADKLGEVNEAVTELIGLQFDDFTRSVVLPQNKFQEFLLSAKADKTKMLERIFYLEEYGRELTDKVNRKLGRIRNKLSGIEGALSVLGDVSEASLREAEAALKAAAENRKTVDEALKASEKEYGSAKEVWELSGELRETEDTQKELLSREAEINSIRSRCRNAAAARALADRVSDLKNTGAELKKTEEELERLNNDLAELNLLLEQRKKEYDEASKQRQERIPLLVEHKTRLAKALQTKDELERLEEVLRKLRNEYQVQKKKVDNWEEVIAGQKARLQEALANAAEKKTLLEALKIDAAYRNKVQKGAALEEELERSQKTMEQQKARFEELSAIIKSQEQELKALTESGLRLQNELETARALYEKHRGMKQWDRNDILKAETRFYSIKAVTDGLKLKDKEIEQLEARMPGFLKQLDTLEKALEELNAKKAGKQKELENIRALLEEKRKEQEKNSSYILAQGLKDNEPCPVCGATSHPRPAASCDSGDMEALAEEIKQIQSSMEKLDMECRSIENDGIKLAEQHNNLRYRKEALEADITGRLEERAELQDRLPEDYRELSVTLIEGSLDKLSEEKQERLRMLEEWEKRLSSLEEAQKKIEQQYNRYQVESSGKRSQLEAGIKHLEELKSAYMEAERDYNSRKASWSGIIEALGISSLKAELLRIQNNDHEAERLYIELQNNENALLELRKEIEKSEEGKKLDVEKLSENIAEGRGYRYQKEEKEKEIQALIGDRDIKAEMAKTEEEMAALTGLEQKALENVNSVREMYEKAVKDKGICEKQREMYLKKLRSDSERLDRELADKGFASVEAVEEAFMPEEELLRQEEAVKAYEEAVSNAKAHKAVIEKKLKGRSITEKLWLEISSRYEELKLSKENSIAAYESAKNKHERISSNYAGWLSLEKELQEYSRKKEHLELFRNLLKGNAFIEYISEERLRYIAREASETLGVLTRHRYGLELDTENGFVIRDDANGGIRRQVTTLSGGETFLTSLALALALSSQIQLKGQCPLEFFFLDEGFGTLDSSLLDTVIDALERLSDQKRVIGLISHVPEMKSRITRRLIVEAPLINGTGSRVYMEKA